MGAERKTWIDVARGAAIILVTLFHATFITESAFGARTGIWPAVNEAMIPIRMPLFFFVSGLLAASAVHRPLVLTRRRTLGFAYIYLIWSVIQLLLDLYLASAAGAPRPSASTILLTMALPTGLWFLWALVAYHLVARGLVLVLRRHAVWAVIPALGLAAVLPLVDEMTAGVVDPFFGAGFFGSVCANFVWFYAGLFGRRWVATLAARRSVVIGVCGVALYLGCYVIATQAGAVYESRWFLSIVALWAAINMLVLVGGDGRIVRALSAVGRRTLPVYVMQWAALFVIARLLLEVPVLSTLLEVNGHPQVLATLIAPVITAVAVATTWWLGGVIAGSPVRWLLEPPIWLVGKPVKPSPDALVPTRRGVAADR